MALQLECDCCHESWNVEQLVFIERYNQFLCPICINEVINSLEEYDER